jgi:hypothetical protein
MEKFTPGPWLVSGNMIYQSGTSHSIALVTVHYPDLSTKSSAACTGRLIAAAPEMYNILKAIVEDENPPLAMIREKAGELLNKINQ